MELRRRLYPRGGSYETTIPKPLLFALDLSKKHLVRFVYDEEQRRWYLDFTEAARDESSRDRAPRVGLPRDGLRRDGAKKRNPAEQRDKLAGLRSDQGGEGA